METASAGNAPAAIEARSDGEEAGSGIPDGTASGTSDPAIVASVADLGVVEETLLIPLVARAIADRDHPQLGFRDAAAEKTIERLGVDPARFSFDRSSMIGSVLRASWFDAVATQFLRRHPAGLCVSLGSGLDARAQRIGIDRFPKARWVDVDFPQVVALRQAVLPEMSQVTALGCDITDPSWLSQIDWPKGHPALFLSEGVLMYLDPADGYGLVLDIVRAAKARTAEIELCFDYSSPMMVRFSRRHPSVSKTRASFTWGIRTPHIFTRLDPRLEIVEHTDIMSECGAFPRLSKALYAVFTLGRRFYGMVRLRRPA